MPLFKYFRSGVYLEKAVRYNELYFSANHELNDPNDLVSFYEFEDDEALWLRLINLPKISEFWDIKKLYPQDSDLIPAINTFFKGRRIFSNFFSLQLFFKEINAELDTFLTPYLSKGLDENPEVGETLAFRLDLFKVGLKELLARGVNHKFFSVSFSEDALNPMMWAHYADGFKGCVLIYKAENDVINLTENLYAGNYTPVDVQSVTYDDSDKFIPLLRCTDTKDKFAIIQEKMLIKNKFWSYENEKRAFVYTEQQSLFIARMPEENFRDDPREKIYHHKPQELLGVIFGPGFDTKKKDKIEYTLRHNRYFSQTGDFLIFDTTLTPSGEIVISGGRRCIVANPGDHSLGTMSQLFEGEMLEKMKAFAGIKKYAK